MDKVKICFVRPKPLCNLSFFSVCFCIYEKCLTNSCMVDRYMDIEKLMATIWKINYGKSVFKANISNLFQGFLSSFVVLFIWLEKVFHLRHSKRKWLLFPTNLSAALGNIVSVIYFFYRIINEWADAMRSYPITLCMQT